MLKEGWLGSDMAAIKEFKVDRLNVKVYGSRPDMGVAAASAVAQKIREMLNSKKEVRIIFAAAPSQMELLENLSNHDELDWAAITAFHMDEYTGLSKNAPQGFGNFLRKYLFDRVPVKTVHFIDPEAADPEMECLRYAGLITEAPIDIICLGIGENGHIAFNDPPVADFYDPVPVKTVSLDRTCRQQQVNDGCFKAIEDVPSKAVTITIPVFMAASFLFVVVPGPTKADAVFHTLHGPINTSCPASILRRHAQAVLYLDRDSSRRLPE